MLTVFNSTRKIIIADRAVLADTFRTRMVGLLNRQSIVDGEGLIITHCQSIHMLFMRFAIDVIFIDNSGKVVGLLEEIQPFRLSPIFLKANRAIELPVKTISKSKTELGDSIQILAA